MVEPLSLFSDLLRYLSLQCCVVCRFYECVHSALAPMWKETAGRRQGSGWLQVLGNAEGIVAESKGQGVSETWRAAVAGAGVRSVLPYLVQLSRAHEQSLESFPLRLHHPLL